MRRIGAVVLTKAATGFKLATPQGLVSRKNRVGPPDVPSASPCFPRSGPQPLSTAGDEIVPQTLVARVTHPAGLFLATQSHRANTIR